MIEKYEPRLLATPTEQEADYQKHRTEWIENKLSDYENYRSTHKDKQNLGIVERRTLAEAEWLNSEYGKEGGREEYYKLSHSTLNAYGQTKLLKKLSEVIEEVNRIAKVVSDAQTMREVERINEIAEGLGSVIGENNEK